MADEIVLQPALQFVLQEAVLDTPLWAAATAFADARALDHILVHADMHIREPGRSEAVCALHEGQIVGLGTRFRPRDGSMLAIAADDDAVFRALLSDLIARAKGRFVVMCRDRDAISVHRVAGLGTGEREIHMVLDGEPPEADLTRVRRVTPDTWGQLVGFYGRLPGQVFFADVFRDNPAYYVEEDGEIVAAAISHFATPRVIQIGGVLTHPDHRRRGHAASIVSALAREARETGRVASLFVRADNDGAIALYERLGFVRYQTMAFFVGGE